MKLLLLLVMVVLLFALLHVVSDLAAATPTSVRNKEALGIENGEGAVTAVCVVLLEEAPVFLLYKTSRPANLCC